MAPSIASVLEKVQQHPHYPWFLTDVTAPLLTQFQEDGRL